LGVVGLVVLLSGCSDDDGGGGPIAPVDTEPPAAPRALYSVTGDERVTLYWIDNTEPDLDGYRVYRGPAPQGPFNPLALVDKHTTSYVDVAVTNGTQYFYAVAAYDLAGNEGELSVEDVFDTPRPAGVNVVLGPAANEQNGPDSGFRFATATVQLSTLASTDVYFDVVGGTRLMIARDNVTDVQDAGFVPLDALDWAPDDGWSPTGTVELIVGHSYYVWTRDNHYAKFRVTALNDTSVRFDWAYQLVGGNPELAPHPRSGAATP
jgi:hypothetical protein